MPFRVWPGKVNWSDPFQVTYKASTEIIVSRAGREQRLGSPDEPRKTFEWSAMVHATTRRMLTGFLATWASKPALVAEAPRSFRLTAPLTAGDATLAVAEVTSWMATDRYLVLNSGSAWGFVQVAAVVGLTLSFVDPVADNWPAGTKVFCASLGRLTAYSATEKTSNAWTVGLSFRADPGSEPAESLGTAGATFNGREIFPFRPNWSDDPSSDFDMPVDEVDYGIGPIAAFWPVEFSSRTRKATFTATTRADVEAIREFFFRMNGRQEEFALATCEPDFEPFYADGNTFKVAGRETYDDFHASTVYKAVRLLYEDGSTEYRNVVLSLDGGGNTVVTTVGGVPWAGGDPETARQISWAPAWRFASDELTIEWLTDSAARVAMSLVTLEDLAGD